MTLKRKISMIVSFICILGVTCFGSLSWAQEKVIKVGGELPLSGPTAPTGALNKQGMDLAVDIITQQNRLIIDGGIFKCGGIHI